MLVYDWRIHFEFLLSRRALRLCNHVFITDAFSVDVLATRVNKPLSQMKKYAWYFHVFIVVQKAYAKILSHNN